MSNESIERLSDQEFYARGVARSRYHDRLFAEGRPRPTNEQFDEGWAAARTYHQHIIKELEGILNSEFAGVLTARETVGQFQRLLNWRSPNPENTVTLGRGTIQPSLSDAIKEVEAMRDD